MIPNRFFGDHGDAARYIEVTKEDMLLCIGTPIIFGATGHLAIQSIEPRLTFFMLMESGRHFDGY